MEFFSRPKSLFEIRFKCWYMSSFHDVYLVFNKNDVWWWLRRVCVMKEAPVSECIHSGKAYVLFFTMSKKDFANIWNLRRVQQLKCRRHDGTDNVINTFSKKRPRSYWYIYCIFPLPFSCKSSRQWNNERYTPLISRSLSRHY